MSDKEQITEVVWNYLNGQNNRKYDLVEKAWHDDCHMFGINAQNEVVVYPRSIWREWFAEPSSLLRTLKLGQLSMEQKELLFTLIT